jgi:hypothetical protein
MTEDKVTCKEHNRQFILTEGCPECLGEQALTPGPINAQLSIIPPSIGNTGDVASTQSTQPTQSPQQALIQVKPDLDRSVVAIYEESCKLLGYAQSRSVKTAEDAKLATDDLAIIANLKKAIEAKRKDYTGPINEHLKAVNQAFQEFTQPLKDADEANRLKILRYEKEQRLNREEQERINRLRIEAAEAEMKLKGELTESVNVVEVQAPPAKIIRASMGKASTFNIWKWEVVDIDQVPKMYLVPDAPKIKKMVEAGGSIPGIRAWQEPSLKVTAKGA